MTTDPFTEAARAEAERRYNRIVRRNKTADEWLDEGRASGFTSGAEWARAYLAAQEPSDAEVEAAQAAVVLHAPDFTKPGVIRCHCGAPGFWSTPDAHEQHALWHALRAARLDEEKR